MSRIENDLRRNGYDPKVFVECEHCGSQVYGMPLCPCSWTMKSLGIDPISINDSPEQTELKREKFKEECRKLGHVW